jgi:hypothetical protein
MTTDRYRDLKTLTIIASRCSKFHNIGSAKPDTAPTFSAMSLSKEPRICA